MEFPFTQEEIGNTIGVSTVHANRMLQDLRSDHLIRQNRRTLQVLDLKQLQQLALFNPNFLHLRSAGALSPGSLRRQNVEVAGRPHSPA